MMDTSKRNKESKYAAFPKINSIRDVVYKKYGNAIFHIKDLYDTAKKSVDALADCAEDLVVMKSNKDAFIIQKGKIDDNIKEVKSELITLKDESGHLKHKIQTCEKEELSVEKNRKKLENDIKNYLARIVVDQPKREKLIRKHSKKLAKLTESISETSDISEK